MGLVLISGVELNLNWLDLGSGLGPIKLGWASGLNLNLMGLNFMGWAYGFGLMV